MPNQLINLAKFFDLTSANLIKSMLEEKNIFSSLSGEYASSVLPINIGNTIYLRVFENDINKSLEIINPYEKKMDFEILIDLA